MFVKKSKLTPRRIPTQDRGRQRVEGILDAAAKVFTEAGFEAATTEAIAARAGASIGSLYQFFPNKQALFNAIAQRYLDKTRATFARVLAESGGGGWEQLLDAAIDAFAAIDREDVDLRAVWTNWHLSGDFLARGQALNRDFARSVEAILADEGRLLAPAKRKLVAMVVVEVISSMLFLAARREPKSGAEVVEETKLLLRRYLVPYAQPRGKSR